MAQNQAVLVLRQAKICHVPVFQCNIEIMGRHFLPNSVSMYFQELRNTEQGSGICTNLQKPRIEFVSFYSKKKKIKKN